MAPYYAPGKPISHPVGDRAGKCQVNDPAAPIQSASHGKWHQCSPPQVLTHVSHTAWWNRTLSNTALCGGAPWSLVCLFAWWPRCKMSWPTLCRKWHQQFKIWPVSETRVDDGKHLLPRIEWNPIFGTPLMSGLLAPLQIRKDLLKSRVRRVRLVGIQIIGGFGWFRLIARSRSAHISEEDIPQGWFKVCALEHFILNRKRVGGNTVNNHRCPSRR